MRRGGQTPECLAEDLELAVLEDERLPRLIEHRRELQVRRELAIDGRDRRIELGLIGGRAAPAEEAEQVHAAILPQAPVSICCMQLPHPV